MDVESPKKPLYRRPRYIVLLTLILLLLALPLASTLVPRGPKTSNQVALDRSVFYFAHTYNSTIGLIPESPGAKTFWLYSDNFLATLALTRYDSSNRSTNGFATALREVLGSYSATLPPDLRQNQYTILNSNVTSFRCSEDVTLGWLSHTGGPTGGSGSAIIRTTANDGTGSCATGNYADLLLLQAIYHDRAGYSNTSASFQQANADFDGVGFADTAYASNLSQSAGVYQTYKLALYVYAIYCLGLQEQYATNLNKAVVILLSLQSATTGGFVTGYTSGATSLNARPISPGTRVNTETTALAALAVELMLHPSSSC